MVTFKTQDAHRAAKELGITEQDINACLRGRSFEDCNQKLEALKVRLKKSYRECALRLHPDRNDGDQAKSDLFRKVVAFWEDIQKLEITPPRSVPRPMGMVIVTSSTASGTTTTTNSTWGGWPVWR